ncbi:MAG: DUF502 domain-containing protein [Bacteroidales bacterium]|nr:DUF502 domain-containing protein [Bacteroidales bacterium]
MAKIIRYFLQGLILIAPLAITVYALVMLFEFVDGLLIRWLTSLIGFKVPGLGLLIILVTITLIGLMGSTILFKPFISALDKLISQAPLVKIIYTSIKDFMSAFVGKDKKFTEPVLVKVSKDADLEKLGFITQHDLSKMGISGNKVAVYLPHSYNFSGNLFIVPIENVRPIDAPPTEVMKFIVTAGVTSIPDTHQKSQENSGTEETNQPLS